MRVAIASRIFEPEPSAASFRLGALASAFSSSGAETEVLTVLPPQGAATNSLNPGYRVKRFPVLRDKTGYVRGYIQYLSFDIPLFFRVLCGRQRDLLVVEPPPTTGFFLRCAAALRRTPYAYYAADIWSDASESTGAPGFVVRVVRAMERFAMTGARDVLSVNSGVTARARAIAPRARVHTIGNGVNTTIFTADLPGRQHGRYLLYAGTASEWQGAGIFIDAFAEVLHDHPGTRLVFLGSGSDWPALKDRAACLPEEAVEFVPTVPPEEAAAWLRGAVMSVASIRPDSGYSFAFPTKVFASWASGTPVVFAGEGPVADFMERHRDEAELGECCNYDKESVAGAMRAVLDNEHESKSREALGAWAADRVSLDAVAGLAVRILGESPERPSGDGLRKENTA